MTEKEWLDLFGDNLVSLLKETGMTQRELADASYLTEGAISSYVNKRKIPSIKAIINMAIAFDIDVSEFIDFGRRII